MPELKTGARLKSAVCDGEIMVVTTPGASPAGMPVAAADGRGEAGSDAADGAGRPRDARGGCALRDHVRGRDEAAPPRGPR